MSFPFPLMELKAMLASALCTILLMDMRLLRIALSLSSGMITSLVSALVMLVLWRILRRSLTFGRLMVKVIHCFVKSRLQR